jgi:hypothetical protein
MGNLYARLQEIIGEKIFRHKVTFDKPVRVTGLTTYATNAAAIAGGLRAGDLYKTGADPDVVCVVH